MILSNKSNFFAVKTTMRTHLHYIFVFLSLTFTFSLTSKANAQQDTDKFVVVLDAGHGGKDPGKHSKYGYKEKDIALKIALAVGKALEKNPNIKVIYTRKTDVFIELIDRPRIANKANADLFVSIHCNAHHSQAYGTETYVLGVTNTKRNLEVAKAENEVIYLEDNHEESYQGFNPDSPESTIGVSIIQEEYTEQSILLASLIEKKFSTKLNRKSRGVKQASLWVIHQTAMPSVLIETGFVTNKNEGAFLNSKKGQLQIANAIKSAIIDYKKELDLNIGTHIIIDGIDEPIVVDSDSEKPEETSEDKVFENIIFKVQIAASSKRLATKSYNFNGLSNITRIKIDRLFKYYYGSTSDYNEALSLVDQAKAKGYSDSYIVAYKDGDAINLSDVIKTNSN